MSTLQILIPTIPSRAESFDALVAELKRQDPAVDIISDDSTTITIGAKRGALIAAATADYVAMIDDDDWPAPDYLERIRAAILPGPDVCGMVIHYTTDNRKPQLYQHSLRFRENWKWTGTDRTPHHLCPVRTVIAQRIPWRDVSWGEDYQDALALLDHLTTEEWTGDAPLYFYRHMTGKPAPHVPTGV
jgi:glycosyltransferase involved in cell wall biosynthesis